MFLKNDYQSNFMTQQGEHDETVKKEPRNVTCAYEQEEGGKEKKQEVEVSQRSILFT